MLSQTFKPNRRYLSKVRLIITVVAFLILAFGVGIVWLITHNDYLHSGDLALFYGGIVAINLLWYVPAMLLTGLYYRSLSYEIQDDEVIVRAGIWTHSVKHVPYRTVTNMTIKRGILDRWFFGLGSLHIQTAGMSGTPGAEEVLEGLSNVQEVYEIVVKELQRFRGAMTPTTTEVTDVSVETADAATSTEALSAILDEVRAIRRSLETG